ncbi:glucose-1-phosphate thymidylyltransferase [Candidatus Pacearchaeota archaeon]|nr:glucose-1-phosphate thymidylyltransferase [Candidatus Pacearchaeota archaeon]|tara:strand:+ start:4474 stop:5325 length:852 start_codon:yes stop_codon:yes gene_type:complete
MKGIILTGGKSSRLYPTALVNNKGLLPVYDKPMIYYPLCTLIENGIKDICIISSPDQINSYRKLLGNGSRFGVKICYKVQKRPEGIAQAFLIAKTFIKGSKVALILGDNIFYGSRVFGRAFRGFRSGGTIFGYEVKDPTRYGVVNFEEGKLASVVEKPKEPSSNYAVPGLYLFDKDVAEITKKHVTPSERGELEIASVINQYIARKSVKLVKINRGCAWLDAGTPKSLHESSEYIKVIEDRQGIKIGCIEEASFRRKFINKKQLTEIAAKMPDSDYKTYLEGL